MLYTTKAWLKTFAVSARYAAICLILIAGTLAGVRAQESLRQDPRPYAPIAIQLPDTLDQLYRDSATIKIGRVRVNQAGYRPNDEKWFYYVGRGGFSGGAFSVIDAETGSQVSTGTLSSKNTNVSSQLKIRASTNAACPGCEAGDERYRMQSEVVAGQLYEGNMGTGLANGRYRVRVGSDTSAPFWVHTDIYSWVRDAAIKFPGINRCGNSDSWFHGACHLQDATLGGWHDCGDHLKEAITQSYLHAMLALGSAALRNHDVDHYGRNHNNTRLTDGVPDVLYEAKHGSDYIINAYENANGVVSNMITSFGERGGGDHQWWGQPEYQDMMPPSRGGPPRPTYRHLGANVLGRFAAGLALTARNYAVFDSAHAAKSIKIAKELYEYAKANRTDVTETAAYSGNGEAEDKLAFGALGLLYATKDRKYLSDLIYDRSFVISNQNSGDFPNLAFDGGWLNYRQRQFSKGNALTDWGSQHVAVLWGFFKLILADEQMCADIGITAEERRILLGRVINQIIYNLADIPVVQDGGSIEIPTWDTGNEWYQPPPIALTFDNTWKYRPISLNWMWNRYQFGHIFDAFAYSDMAMWLEDNDIQIPNRTATNWNGRSVRELMIRQVDYMLGVNQWDISMIFGIGAKNHNHPHHRAANPEGRNVPGAFYKYRPPVGGLAAGTWPENEHYDRVEAWKDHELTETGIDASATIIIPLMALSRPDPITDPPTATVRTVYIGYDQAIIEIRQSRFGMSTIRYGAEGTNPNISVSADSNGMFHRITLTGLNADTRYNFDVLISDMFGNSAVITDRNGEPFTFVTLREPPDNAEITNVKVCKVTADSAEIFWYTPNGNYDSRVVFGTSKPVTANNGTVVDGNIYGRPSQFHYVKIGGLKEKTTYYFYVENNGTRDDNGGQFYQFTTPVMHVAFDVRLIKYADDFFGLNIVNQDVKAYDSLELRIYVRMPDTINTGLPAPNARRAFSEHIGLRVDIGIKYRSDGYQDTHFKQEVDDFVQRARPVRIDDTYNPADNTWAFYIPVPMGAAEMQSGARFRLDLMFDTRSHFEPYEDLMNVKPPADVLNSIWSGWSFSAHSRDNGDPVDYPGIPSGSKTDVDDIYHITPINNYVTIYRKNEFVWGYSPSALEQQEKKTHYQLMSQIVRPIHNPSEEYLFLEQVMPSITVNGYAKLTDEAGNTNGEITEIWVNGVRVRDVGSVAQYSSASDLWNLSIPVPVRNGGNNVDITIFGGPDPNCASCHGCAFTNHSFYVEFRGADPYPSSIKLLTARDINSAEVKDTAVIGSTRFYIYVDDENGNLNKDARDTVWVTVENPVIGNSIRVALIETGNETGQFLSDIMISVVDHTQTTFGPNDIPMDGGQVIWVTYVDITDPNDVSRAILSSRAEFAVPSAAWFKDRLGVGSIDQVFIRYDKIPNPIPDSLHLTVPGETAPRTVRAPNIAAVADDRSVVMFTLDPPIEGKTGFGSGHGEIMSARSFLLYNNIVRVAVIPVTDSAGPALLDRALLFEKNTASALDTLLVTLSEPMPSSNILGNTLILRKPDGTNTQLTVTAAIDSSSLTNSLTLVADPQGTRILEGDSIWINPTSGGAFDRAGNRAHDANRPVPVALRSSAPRFTSAFYRDLDGNGMIDEVELNLSRSLDLTGLRLWLAWENGTFVPVEWDNLSINSTETTVRVAMERLLTGDSVITVGTMRAMATHNRFPGDTLRTNVTDRAAPVILRAQFAPGTENGKDTLNVTFSEPIRAAQARPFKFLYNEDGGTLVYEMVLENRNPAAISASHSFVVNGIENPVGYPGKNDSVWVSVDVVIADTSANIQSVENNRRVKLSIKPAPLTITVIPAPNPFEPGQKNGGRPARIIVRPASKTLTDLNLKGTISIYDKLGNIVLTGDLQTQPDSPDLIYEWSGLNKKGRRAGTGTYLLVATVEHVQEAWEEKIRPVTGRARVYLKRR